LISTSIEVYGCKTKVIAVYAPTEESAESSKDSFYHELCKHLTTLKHEKLIVLGDFNATTTAVKNHACVRSSSILYDIESNDNGIRIDFARENTNSHGTPMMYMVPKKHLTTCYAPTDFVNMFLTVVSEEASTSIVITNL